MAGGAELLLQGFPEAESAVADREFGRDRQTAAFEIGQELGPGLGALAKARLKTDQLFPAFGRAPIRTRMHCFSTSILACRYTPSAQM